MNVIYVLLLTTAGIAPTPMAYFKEWVGAGGCEEARWFYEQINQQPQAAHYDGTLRCIAMPGLTIDYQPFAKQPYLVVKKAAVPGGLRVRRPAKPRPGIPGAVIVRHPAPRTETISVY